MKMQNHLKQQTGITWVVNFFGARSVLTKSEILYKAGELETLSIQEKNIWMENGVTLSNLKDGCCLPCKKQVDSL